MSITKRFLITMYRRKALRAGLFSVLGLLLIQCHSTHNKPSAHQPSLTEIARRHFSEGNYDSAIRCWNQAFAFFKKDNRWDSIYAYEEKYIIAHSRIYNVQEGNAFLDELGAHLLAQNPVDSIELSKLWVRRSEMLYTDGKPRLARDTLFAVLYLRERLLKYPHPLLADACDYLQIAIAQDNDYWTAAGYGENGINIYKACVAGKWNKGKTTNLPWLIGNTGELYNELGYYDKGITLLREAYDSLCADHAPLDSRLYYQIQLGSSYRRKGDFRAAISIFEAAADSLRATDNRSFAAEADKQLALCYKETGLRDQMLLYARKQYDIYSVIHNGRSHQELAESASLLADCFLSADDIADAAKYIKEAQRIFKANNDAASIDYLETLSLQGQLFRKRGFADSARIAFDSVVKKRTALLSDTNDLVATALLEAARNEDAAGQFKLSGNEAQKALIIFSRTRNAGHPYIKDCLYLLARARWKGAGDKRGALRLIEQGTGANTMPVAQARYENADRSYLHLLELSVQIQLPDDGSNDTAAWKASLAGYQRLAAAYRHFLNYSVFEGAHFAEGGSTIQAIKDGFLPAFRLYQLTGDERYMQAALDFSEQSRTGSIRLALQHYEANKFAHVPDSVISSEEQLRISCAYYEKLLLSAAGIKAPPAQVAQWSDSLMAQRYAYAGFISRMAQQYPAYYQLKLGDKTISVAALKELAAAGHTAVLEYIISGSRLYVFVCNNGRCDLRQLPVSKDSLTLFTDAYRNSMARADAAPFADAAWHLYAAAVLPVASLLGANNVCVIPDDALNYVSFESLLTEPVQKNKGLVSFRNLPYAIRKTNWKYAYSATVLAQQSALYSREKNGAAQELVAMAPGFDKDVKGAAGKARSDSLFLHLLRQPWAMALAGNLKKSLGADAVTGRKATEESYDHLAEDASVMYIGTHAFPDDNDPMQSELVFSKSPDAGIINSDGYLHAYEIYRSPVQMRLLVLGGCETGIGRLRSGEGIVSLASGFAYAGCPSIVMSLWSIDDKQTATVLGSFFKNAGNHQPVSEALSGAKRLYLQQAGDDALYNPLYWSGLVSIGLDEPVPVPAQHSFRYRAAIPAMIFTIAGISMLLIILKRKSGCKILPCDITKIEK